MILFVFISFLITFIPHGNARLGASAPIHQEQQINLTANSRLPLTIAEAVEIAMLNKPNLQAYKYAIEASKAKGMQVWSEYLPQVGIDATINKSLGIGNPQTTVALGAQQLIYSFAGPIEKYKLAKKQTNIVQLTNNKDKKAVRNAVETAFLECWKTQQQQLFIQSLHKSSTTTYQRQAHANKLQLLDKSDWLKSSSDHVKNLALIDNYYEGLELTQKKLEFFMGQPIDLAVKKLEKPTSMPNKNKQHTLTLDLTWQEPKDVKLQPLTTYYKYAKLHRDELKIADKQVGIAKDQAYIAQRSNLPSMSLYGKTGYAGRESTTEGLLAAQLGQGASVPRNFYNVGVSVKWPIFNGLLHNHEEKEAHANMVKEMLTKDQVAQDIRLAIDTAYHTLQQALNNLKAKKTDLLYTRNNLTLKKQHFKIGIISRVELDAAQTEWELAEYNWLEMVADAAIKERNLVYASGYPKELDDQPKTSLSRSSTYHRSRMNSNVH